MLRLIFHDYDINWRLEVEARYQGRRGHNGLVVVEKKGGKGIWGISVI